MVDEVLGLGLQYSGYALYIGLCWLLLRRGHCRRLSGVTLYLASLLAIDAAGRPYVLYRYGLASREYSDFFYLTDVFLALAAFMLVCTFFRRACAGEEKLWHFLRLLLVFVLVLVFGISSISISRNYDQLFTRFIYEFEQNLYFTCLVLNTLLYILMRQIQTTDDELELLVCGVGIQFAGPAANLALVYLTPGQPHAQGLLKYVPALCTLGMLLIWIYAVARAAKPAAAPAGEAQVLGYSGMATRET